jgi:hypothetical protein
LELNRNKEEGNNLFKQHSSGARANSPVPISDLKMKKRCSSEQKKRERVARAPLKSCFSKLSKLFPILKRMGEKSRYAR